MRAFFGPIGAALLLGTALVLPAGGGASGDTITLRSDEWCPYNCAPDSDRPGYMIEIAREVFGRAGHTVDYRTLGSWVRAIEEVRAGRSTALVGATPDEVPDFVFPREALGANSDGFAVRRGVPFRYGGPDSFEGLTVGAIQGYGYVGALGEYVETHAHDPSKVQLIAGDDALERNLRKLTAGRVDLVVDDVYALRLAIHELGLDDEVEIADRDPPDPVYIAFSPAVPEAEAYAALLDRGVAELRASGRLAEILVRYGLSDWEQDTGP
jgi:polar amino acid transport system substrate-binding protein